MGANVSENEGRLPLSMNDALRILVVSLILYGALAYIALWLYAVVRGSSKVFPVPPAGYDEERFPLRLPADDGSEIVAVWLPAVSAREPILYCHGNGEDLADIFPWLQTLNRRGYNVLAVDYPGYGLTEGKPCEDACYVAVDAAYKHLTQLLNIPPSRILAYGRSLGSGPAIDLATREALGGLIIDGAFTSTFRTVTRVRLLPWDVFDNLPKMPFVRCPILSLHGGRDRVVPYAHAQKLYAAATAPRQRLWEPEAGHNDLVKIAGERFWTTLRSFCDTVCQ